MKIIEFKPFSNLLPLGWNRGFPFFSSSLGSLSPSFLKAPLPPFSELIGGLSLARTLLRRNKEREVETG